MGPVYMTQSTGAGFLQAADYAKPADFEDPQLDQHGRETLSDTLPLPRGKPTRISVRQNDGSDISSRQ